MRMTTIGSAMLLGLSGAALAQVATSPEPKPGTSAGANVQAGNTADDPAGNAAGSTADNVSDPGKR